VTKPLHRVSPFPDRLAMASKCQRRAVRMARWSRFTRNRGMVALFSDAPNGQTGNRQRCLGDSIRTRLGPQAKLPGMKEFAAGARHVAWI
jgi:hypothetical protein